MSDSFNDTRVWTVYTKFAVASGAFANAALTWGTGNPVTAANAKFTGPTTVVASKGGVIHFCVAGDFSLLVATV